MKKRFGGRMRGTSDTMTEVALTLLLVLVVTGSAGATTTLEVTGGQFYSDSFLDAWDVFFGFGGNGFQIGPGSYSSAFDWSPGEEHAFFLLDNPCCGAPSLPNNYVRLTFRNDVISTWPGPGERRELPFRMTGETGLIDFNTLPPTLHPQAELIGQGVLTIGTFLAIPELQYYVFFYSFVFTRQVLACDGFASPADAEIRLASKSNRLIPLRMTLQDSWSHAPVTSANIAGGAAPVLQISFSPREGVPFVPVGAPSGDAFTDDGRAHVWRLNLSTKLFTAAGRYIVTVQPGSSDYAIGHPDDNPTCEARFVRE